MTCLVAFVAGGLVTGTVVYLVGRWLSDRAADRWWREQMTLPRNWADDVLDEIRGLPESEIA